MSKVYWYKNAGQTLSDAEDLGWVNPLPDVTDDTDPARIDAAEQSALHYLLAQGLVLMGEDMGGEE